MGSIEERLEELDHKIVYLARRFQRKGIEVDDLAQIGRIAAWESGNKVNHPGYMFKAAKYAILGYINSQRAQKRTPPLGQISLDKTIGEGSATLHDIIADKRQIAPRDFSTAEEEFLNNFQRDLRSIDLGEYNGSIVGFLKERFGERYIRNIKLFTQPKKIVRKVFKTTIEEILKVPKDKIATEVDYDFFIKNKLIPLLHVFYSNSSTEVKIDLYPDLKEWQFKYAPDGYWEGKKGYERAVGAVKDFCDEKGISSIEDCESITFKDFADRGLGGALEAVFSRSPFLALKSVFPNFSKKDKKHVKNRFPDEESVKQGLLEYFIEKGIGNIEHQTTEELFDGHIKSLHPTDLRKKFSPIIQKRFNGSAYNLLAHYFPNQIRPWLIRGTHSGWNKGKVKVAADAIRWLFESYLGIKENEIPAYSTYSNLHNLGFGSLLTNKPFNGNMYKLISNAYPGRFTKEQFGRNRPRTSIEV